MRKQRFTTMPELVERFEDGMNQTAQAAQIEKFRAIEGDDFMSDQNTEKPISVETLRFLAAYKAPPKNNPFKKLF